MTKKPDSEGAEESFYRKLGISLFGLQAAMAAIEANRDTGNVVCLVGESGIGKSHIVRQVFARRRPRKTFTWKGQEWTTAVPLLAFYLQHLQPEDIAVPYPSQAKLSDLLQRATQMQQLAQFVRTQGTSTEFEGIARNLDAQVLDAARKIAHLDDRTRRNGTMEFLINRELFDLPPECGLFFDEYNRGEKGTVKTFFTLMEDGQVHGVDIIKPGTQIVAAMNPSDGAYSVNEAEKDPAIKRRLCFIAVTCNVAGWLIYARGKFHSHVVDYIQDNNVALYDPKLRLAGKVYPSPATWEKVSRLLQAAEGAGTLDISNGVSDALQACIIGHVGEAIGSQFCEYMKNRAVVIATADVLGKYQEKSTVRRKVLRLVEDARHDVLGDLCANVATMLLGTKPEPREVAPKLGLFLGDLPSDLAVSFIASKLRAAQEGIGDVSPYLSSLSKELAKQQSYQRHIKGITDALAQAAKEGGGPDPLA
jgi:MoxR-like ATPase